MEPDENYPFFFAAFRHFVPEDMQDGKRKRDGEQKRLSSKAGISQSSFSMIWTGKKLGSMRTHAKIANAIGKGYSYDEFIKIGRILKNQPEPTASNVIPINGLAKDPRLQVTIDKLTKIFSVGTLDDIEYAEKTINKWLELIELKQKEPKREIEKLAK